MDGFTDKLRCIYTKMFQSNIDRFTEDFIDKHKFDREKFRDLSEEEAKKQFFLNRKTVLRRWLRTNLECTGDFKKSFNHYKVAQYIFGGEKLFQVTDFTHLLSVVAFEKKVDAYLLEQEKFFVNTEYQYIYLYSEDKQDVDAYKIVEWRRGEGREAKIVLEKDKQEYFGTFLFKEYNNIFMTIQIDGLTRYFLFHDNYDTSCSYIVGVTMGYASFDNKVPRAQKVLLSKKEIEQDTMEIEFILNEVESIVAIENRLTLHNPEIEISPFVKFSNQFKKYQTFFMRLIQKKFNTSFYYRLAFHQFSIFQKLFERVVRGESYFVVDYHDAFHELVSTMESIKKSPLFIVSEYSKENFFVDLELTDTLLKERFLNLHEIGIETTLIFIIEEETIPLLLQHLIEEFQKKGIVVHLVQRKDVIHQINSVNFFFIHLQDKRDFVFADPIRDNKDVFKLFTHEITMEEYRTDYRKILRASRYFKG